MTAVEIVRSIAADRNSVWRAWTDPAELAGWFWPERFHSTCTMEVTVGGRWRIESGAAGMAVSGEFVAVEPEDRLVLTWRWDGEEQETLLTVTFADRGTGRTELRILHENFSGAAESETHQQGWNDCLDRLPGYLGAGVEEIPAR